jgi:hypothetical protein
MKQVQGGGLINDAIHGVVALTSIVAKDLLKVVSPIV